MDSIQPHLNISLLKGRWGSSRADGSCALPTIRPLLLCWGLQSPVMQVAEGQVFLCWSKAFQLAAARQTHPSVLGRDQLLFPASTAPGSWAVAVHMQTHPASAHPPASAFSFLQSGFFCIHAEGGTPPLKWGHLPPPPKCYVPLYCFPHCLLHSQCQASSVMWNYWINMTNILSPTEPCQRL